jgi:predicted dehydrogenase
MKKIKLSFIGAGLQSQIAHIINFYKDKRVELFDVADFDLDLAKGIKKKFNFSGVATRSADEIINRKPDGVVIVVQRPLVSNLVKQSLKAKLNVLSEKPHVFSLKEHNECEKYQNKIVWMKGYNRRWALAAIEFKKNFSKYKKKYGNLVSVEMFCDSGNSWLGNKHFVFPTLEKKFFSGKKNKYPNWIKSKNKILYENYWNGASHFMDLLEFFDFKKIRNFNSYINDKVFNTMFIANKSSQNFLVNVTMSKFSHNGWNEYATFNFERAKVTLRYNSPMQYGGSCSLEVSDSSDKKFFKTYKNNWHYEYQNQNFISEIIKQKKGKLTNYLNGKTSISTYENIWKNFQKSK